jgi:NADPH:quinone reductase-like Zn-dependent oxidoreductase
LLEVIPLFQHVHWKHIDNVTSDPIYPIVNLPNLTPCIDGAGEIFSVGPKSIWKVGDRVIINPTSRIDSEDVPTLENSRGKGAGDVQGTLR